MRVLVVAIASSAAISLAALLAPSATPNLVVPAAAAKPPTKKPTPTSTPTATTATPIPTPTPTATGSTRALLWSDEFGAAADTAPSNQKWRLSLYNEDSNCWTRDLENAHHDGAGNMIITAVKESCTDGTTTKGYTSARLVNQDLDPIKRPTDGQPFYHIGGRWEVRAKVPAGSGLVVAPLWTMGDYDATPGGWPECGEIDVIETKNSAGTAYGHLHMDGGSGADYGPGVEKAAPNTTWADGQFHTFVADWTADGVAWEVDGVVYGMISKYQVEAAGKTWPFNTIPQSPIISLHVGKSWSGQPDGSWISKSMILDYVRVYE